jgi:hypothetical protein
MWVKNWKVIKLSLTSVSCCVVPIVSWITNLKETSSRWLYNPENSTFMFPDRDF